MQVNLNTTITPGSSLSEPAPMPGESASEDSRIMDLLKELMSLLRKRHRRGHRGHKGIGAGSGKKYDQGQRDSSLDNMIMMLLRLIMQRMQQG